MRQKVDKIVEVMLISILGIMLMNVVWQVVSRYVVGVPSTATDELSRYGLIWLGIMGGAYATGKGLHLAIDIVPNSLHGKKKELLDGFINTMIFLFSAIVMIVGGVKLTYVTYSLGQVSSSLGVQLGVIYAIVPISGLLICYYSMHNIYLIFSKKIS
ncbi:C4-dicarboxylate ABC transporter permease [Marivirga lumbricoides]|uniref:C4-dicarboxylate ABC transporter permease n=1 Tax=Marivirga lumbricoides TaxID=1046115 RepID=A0ABQ1MVL4_9BACT|nr:C4-dicarboxylate ABC transporter permease [Marivirga lumbricoides]